VIDGLVQNKLDDYTYLLTGYIGSASFLKSVALFVKTLKSKNVDLIYGMTFFRIIFNKFACVNILWLILLYIMFNSL